MFFIPLQNYNFNFNRDFTCACILCQYFLWTFFRICGVDYPKDKVILHVFPRSTANIPNMGHFVMKLETYLRIHRIPFQVRDFTIFPKLVHTNIFRGWSYSLLIIIYLLHYIWWLICTMSYSRLARKCENTTILIWLFVFLCFSYLSHFRAATRRHESYSFSCGRAKRQKVENSKTRHCPLLSCFRPFVTLSKTLMANEHGVKIVCIFAIFFNLLCRMAPWCFVFLPRHTVLQKSATIVIWQFHNFSLNMKLSSEQIKIYNVEIRRFWLTFIALAHFSWISTTQEGQRRRRHG